LENFPRKRLMRLDSAKRDVLKIRFKMIEMMIKWPNCAKKRSLRMTRKEKRLRRRVVVFVWG